MRFSALAEIFLRVVVERVVLVVRVVLAGTTVVVAVRERVAREAGVLLT